MNCVDRHVEAGHGDQVAYHFEGEPGDTRDITYAELLAEVCKAANALESLGVTAGDRVAIYLPMIPEAAVAMLACARIGAVHSVVFGGFSAEALRSRIEDAEAVLVITTDGGHRKGKPMALKPAVDEAVAAVAVGAQRARRQAHGPGRATGPTRTSGGTTLVDAQPDTHEAQAFDAEHPLFILYTSGTTGKPKGILHTTGGYLTQVDVHASQASSTSSPTPTCTGAPPTSAGSPATPTSSTGRWPTAATSLMYEGTPGHPAQRPLVGARREVQRLDPLHRAHGDPHVHEVGRGHPRRSFDLSSLRVLGSVGEPINPEAWMWYRRVIGGDRCPIVDTWWQTETGAIMISPLPGVTATKPGSAMGALPGIGAEVVDDEAHPVGNGGGGYLVLTEPWPSMLRGIWGDNDRYVETYWSRWQGLYFAGDGAKLDEDGAIWLLGRVDDVMNVSGHRISTTEVESALVSHPIVAEAAVVGATDDTTGQGIVAFVILREGVEPGDRRHHRPAQPRRARDRPDRQAAPDPRRARAAQDPVRQDHAPAAARHRREPRRRRHHHARRPDVMALIGANLANSSGTED